MAAAGAVSQDSELEQNKILERFMNIIEKRLDEIQPYEHNPRNNDAAVEYVANSLREFGWKQPIVIDKDGIIIAGHTRYKAAQRLGMKTAPCIMADDLTPEQVKAYRLADNKTGEFAEWDFSELEMELADIEMDMSAFGFLEEELNDVEAVEDDGPSEPPAEPKAKRGDIYKLGRHRLMCGDSTDAEDVAELMGGRAIGMIYTDPPYGMNLDTDFSGMKNHLDFAQEKGFEGGKKYDAGIVDDFSPEMITAVFAIPADEVFLWGADYYAELIPDRNSGAWIVWDKRSNGNDDIAEYYQSDKMYGSCFELCWSKKKHKRDIARVKWAGVFGVEQEPEKRRFHPTQKPVGLSAWFIKKYSKANDTVLDLFGGSGSTLIACEQLNRDCFMMELDPKYIDVIIERWESFTGQKAVLISERKG